MRFQVYNLGFATMFRLKWQQFHPSYTFVYWCAFDCKKIRKISIESYFSAELNGIYEYWVYNIGFQTMLRLLVIYPSNIYLNIKMYQYIRKRSNLINKVKTYRINFFRVDHLLPRRARNKLWMHVYHCRKCVSYPVFQSFDKVL